MTVLAITKDGSPGVFLRVDEKTTPGDCMSFIKSATEAVLACKEELEASANTLGKTHDHRFNRSCGAVAIDRPDQKGR